MSKFKEIANEVRNEHKFDSWDDLFEESTKLYATLVAENLREEILDEIGGMSEQIIRSIKEIKIVLP